MHSIDIVYKSIETFWKHWYFKTDNFIFHFNLTISLISNFQYNYLYCILSIFGTVAKCLEWRLKHSKMHKFWNLYSIFLVFCQYLANVVSVLVFMKLSYITNFSATILSIIDLNVFYYRWVEATLNILFRKKGCNGFKIR